MRKLIVSMNVTLDGFIAGPCGELDWHFRCWTDEMAGALAKQLAEADTILLGRVTYMAMAAYWPAKAADPSFPREDVAFADMMNSYTKIVFSNTLKTAIWSNTRLVKKNMANEIINLKHQHGKNMIIYGSGKLTSALIKQGLIDEYQLWMHPVILGKGEPLFKSPGYKLDLELVDTIAFNSGVVMLYYRPR